MERPIGLTSGVLVEYGSECLATALHRAGDFILGHVRDVVLTLVVSRAVLGHILIGLTWGSLALTVTQLGWWASSCLNRSPLLIHRHPYFHVCCPGSLVYRGTRACRVSAAHLRWAHTHSGRSSSRWPPSFRLFSHLWLELLARLHRYHAPVSVGTAMECVELCIAPPNGLSIFWLFKELLALYCGIVWWNAFILCVCVIKKID